MEENGSTVYREIGFSSKPISEVDLWQECNYIQKSSNAWDAEWDAKTMKSDLTYKQDICFDFPWRNNDYQTPIWPDAHPHMSSCDSREHEDRNENRNK